jgi:hypothetical protein
MTELEEDCHAREETFSLEVDQYGRLWLHTKLAGQYVAIDLAEKRAAFRIMVETMAQEGFEYAPAGDAHHADADNDDRPSGIR